MLELTFKFICCFFVGWLTITLISIALNSMEKKG